MSKPTQDVEQGQIAPNPSYSEGYTAEQRDAIESCDYGTTVCRDGRYECPAWAFCVGNPTTNALLKSHVRLEAENERYRELAEYDCENCVNRIRIPAEECQVLVINKQHMAERDEALADLATERKVSEWLAEYHGQSVEEDSAWPWTQAETKSLIRAAREAVKGKSDD